MDADQPFDLAQFFPYRLAVLAELISQAVALTYTDRFSLGRAEWRILAALGNNATMSARDLGPYSALDKMQVSRALARLVEKGLVTRKEKAEDRRVKLLYLTPKGQELYRCIIPLAKAREAALLSALDETERALLERAAGKLQRCARSLIDRQGG